MKRKTKEELQKGLKSMKNIEIKPEYQLPDGDMVVQEYDARMKAKLQVHGHSYVLIHEGKTIAFAHPEDFSSDDVIGKISLKNCQVIENGYDLDELANQFYMTDNNHKASIHSFKTGFQKAMEILVDKKFSLEDMIKCSVEHARFCSTLKNNIPNLSAWINNEGKNYIQSLQQNEWDVEIITEFVEEEKTGLPELSWGRLAPKLDADGCLILKKV